MVTKEELEKRYAELSNKELLDIIENKFSYTELAIAVALEEISKRKLDEELTKRKLKLEKTKANQALESPESVSSSSGKKCLFFTHRESAITGSSSWFLCQV